MRLRRNFCDICDKWQIDQCVFTQLTFTLNYYQVAMTFEVKIKDTVKTQSISV